MTTTALQLQDVRKHFGPAEIIRGVDLEVSSGERHAIIGPNGAGKSTLFNLISGRFHPSAGHIRLKGDEITRRSAFAIARSGLSRSFQVTNIFHNLTVFENLRCAVLWSLGYRYNFWRRIKALKDVQARATELLELTHLGPRRDLLAGELPYADQRALEIGITIAGGADVILLDEPTAGMSVEETERAVALIQRVSEGKTLLMVEHDMEVVFGLADRISVLVYGQIIATDTPEAIRSNSEVQKAYLGETPDQEPRHAGSQ